MSKVIFSNINDFIKKSNKNLSCSYDIRSRIVLADGTSLSVQASDLHHCFPRENLLDEYEAVEMGFPKLGYNCNGFPAYLLEYADDIENPERSEYPYIPVVVLDRFINEHGGIIGITPRTISSYK